MESNDKRPKKGAEAREPRAEQRGKRSFDRGSNFQGEKGSEISFDYKNVELLKRYITDRGKIVPARISKLPAKQQRALARAVKRARQVALIPYSGGHWSTIHSRV